jgi:hypothetical protein
MTGMRHLPRTFLKFSASRLHFGARVVQQNRSSTMADRLDGLIISEILADNAGNAATDTDGDGRTNKADEFVEIQNASNSAMSLDGYEIWSEKQGQLYSFGATDTIAANGTATVVGNYTGAPPTGFYSAGVSENTNWLPDGEGQKFDSIFLVNTATGDYVVLSYGQPPRAPTLPANFPGTTRIGAGEQINSNAPNGTAFSRNVDGDFVERAPTPDTPGVPCFVKGTLIETDRGVVAVEHLAPGAKVATRDRGWQPILAIRAVHVSAAMLRADPDLQPVILPPGTQGAKTALSVSPSHRIMLQGAQSQLLFGSPEVLVAAHHLVGAGAIRARTTGQPVVYYHLLLERHEILQVHGIWTETLFIGDIAVPGRTCLAQWQIDKGVNLRMLRHNATARPVLRGFEAQLMLRQPAEGIRARVA